MAIPAKMLSGSEIIQQKLYGPKDLPTSGWKEYCPSNSWLEQKQIQACLEEKFSTIGVERIEKQNNLAQAEWINECKKAKVLKKVGKYWEVVGHHQDNEDWLLPEEALYLIEINVLELYHGGVPVSVEHAYALLLSESHNCTLQEYRVYSYLSRRGYKIIRHAEDITVTKYEKQIHLDQVLETQKRNIPIISEEPNSQALEELPSNTNDISKISEDIPNILNEDLTKNSIETTSNLEDNTKEISTKRAVSDCEDLCIIEDNVEVIEIEDSSHKKTSNKSIEEFVLSKEAKVGKQVNSNKPECVIIIDDEDDEDMDIIKQESESESSEIESDDEVILIKSVQAKSQHWYQPLRKSLVSSEVVVVDLSEDVEVKVEPKNWNDECLQIIASKSRNDILDEMTNAKGGVSFIKAPNGCFLPSGIVPKHSQYRVNLNMRQDPNVQQHPGPNYNPGRRYQLQYFSPNHANNQVANNSYLGDNVLMQAFEMRAMAMSMIQAASSLMSAVNPQPALTNSPLINDLQIPSFYTPQTQFPNQNFSPRIFNNNFFNNNLFGNPRNTFMPRNNNFFYGRRNTRFRGYRNNNNRSFSPHQRQMTRYHSRNTNSNTPEIVMIDSDDDSVSDQRTKRRSNNYIDIPPKKSKHIKIIEIIDLCDDKPVKIEPVELSKNKPQNQSFNSAQKKKTNDNIDKKPNIEIECKQEILNVEVEERLHPDELLLETKKEMEVLLNIDNSDVKCEKLDESVNEFNSEIETDVTCKTEITQKKVEMIVSESSFSSMEIVSSESPRIIEESNDSEVANIMESSVAETDTCVPDQELVTEGPTSWQQFKEQSEVTEKSPEGQEKRDNEGVTPLSQPEQVKDIAKLFKKLQIFQTIDEVPDNEGRRKLKISFDAYLPSDHFKKSLKMLPKFRIIVVKSTDSVPSKLEIDILKTNYQDGISFLYAIVYDDTISFYYHDAVSLPDYFNE